MIVLSYVALWKRPVADSVLLATQSLLSADLQGAVRTLPVGTAHVTEPREAPASVMK